MSHSSLIIFLRVLVIPCIVDVDTFAPVLVNSIVVYCIPTIKSNIYNIQMDCSVEDIQVLIQC